jgi:hypothetical protein
MHAGHKVLVEVDGNRAMIVGDPQTKTVAILWLVL